MLCSHEFYLEPKLKVESMVADAGIDADGRRVLNFDVVDIGDTVEASSAL
jgi:hypothetical protein